MHILIDLQGAQSESRYRGIGRYALQFSLALARLARGQHRIALLLNTAFADTIDPLREAFADLVADEDIHLWTPLTPCHALDPANNWRRAASEELYNAKIRQLQPDWLLITSVFEGQWDGAVSAVGHSTVSTAVILYDLIPLIHKEKYLAHPVASCWYHHQLAWLRNADLLLCISNSSAQEAIDYLNCPRDRLAVISSATDDRFRVINIEQAKKEELVRKYGITRNIVIRAGEPTDSHKNVPNLIAAYSKLPQSIRQEHQLVLVYDVSEEARKFLRTAAKQHHLLDDELILTGRVSDDDLVALYNISTLSVLPSLHEGFGLPALEAMACGTPVLASNTTSLPEVVGLDEALFDPLNVDEIAALMQRALSDADFRTKLSKHGMLQATKFSWEKTAQRALEALESHALPNTKSNLDTLPTAQPQHKPLLAYVSPLQSAKSGIADYSAELLPELARQYDIEVIVHQEEPLTDPWVLANARQRSVEEFVVRAQRYDRVLYHIGNSPYHAHIPDLLERVPGVVVLHDFFMGSIYQMREHSGTAPGCWSHALLHSHGWEALKNRLQVKNEEEIIDRWPSNLPLIQRALGVIVHSEYLRQLAVQWYGHGFAVDWAVIPYLRQTIPRIDRQAARATLGLQDDDMLVCSFGVLSASKLNHRLVDAWLASDLAHDPRSRLVFVGQADGEYGDQLLQRMRAARARISITGWTEESTYRNYLAAADMAVQLRDINYGEISGTVLDCMNAGLATICNANGSLAELPHDSVWMLDEDFSNVDLIKALQTLRANTARRKELGSKAQVHIREHHQPRICAGQYAQAIESAYADAQQGMLGFVDTVRWLGSSNHLGDLALAAVHVAEQFPPLRPNVRQLFVDISELHRRDAKTGIQRVTHSVITTLVDISLENYRVEFVYLSGEGYRYARGFTANLLKINGQYEDDLISPRYGDVFWGVDLHPGDIPSRSQIFRSWRLHGVKVIFTVYDLIPLSLPHTCDNNVSDSYLKWFQILPEISNGLIAISETVAREIKQWLSLFDSQQTRPIQIGWAHLGSEMVEHAKIDHQWQPNPQQRRTLEAIAGCPAFLMVGTLEPRKGHAQVMAAFEWLWAQGHKINLVIVGKKGWKLDELVEMIRQHPKLERHLFWLEAIDDDYLEAVYAASACLIAASYGEGFGLPLVEAARHKLPILARDIPAFREVAGSHASYFSGLGPVDLADAVLQWLERAKAGYTISSEGMPWLTWAQATQAMLKVVLDDQWQDRWVPQKDDTLVARYWGSDPRLFTEVGERTGTALWSTGQAGHLLYGPYLSLPPGRYVATLTGKVGIAGVNGVIADVCIDGGKEILADCVLQGSWPEQEQTLARLEFTLTRPAQQLEVRVETQEMSDIAIAMLEIRRADGLPTPQLPPATRTAKEAEPVLAYWATHPKLASPIGYAAGRTLYSTAKTGYLLRGPHAALPAGRYVVRIYGGMQGDGQVRADVCISQDTQILVERVLSGEATKGRDGVLVAMEFELRWYVSDLEVRIDVLKTSDIMLNGCRVYAGHGEIVYSMDAQKSSTREVSDSLETENEKQEEMK